MKLNKRQLVGRDPAKGLLAFATGAIPTLKDRLRNRNSKASRNFLRRQLRQK
jgi:hypothetical protein